MFNLKLIVYCVSLFLITIIAFRNPEENNGLTSFANTTNLLGSPSSARRLLNIFTFISIIIYLGIAIKLNIIDLDT